MVGEKRLLDQSDTSYDVAVVGAYIVHQEKLLLLRRSLSEDFLPGFVELPSGGVDDGETLQQALAREVLEETGLKIKQIGTCINSFDYISGTGKKARQFNYHVTLHDPIEVILNPEEHDAFYWVDLNPTALAPHALSEKTSSVIIDALSQLQNLIHSKT